MEYIGNTWAEVDLTALKNNFLTLRGQYGAGRKCFSIVKTDAYGHGAVAVARALAEAGSEAFSVSTILEAEQLRQNGITQPILILGYTPPALAGRLAFGGIHRCVYSLEYAQKLEQQAAEAGVCVKVHLKLDTGMGRLGFDCRSEAGQGQEEAKAVLALEHLEAVGVFMHFATADYDAAFAQQQDGRFWAAVESLEAEGHAFSYLHLCNSAAAVNCEPKGNAIRPGIVLYGLSPASQVALPEGFQPVMSLYTTVSMVKEIADGQSVSYGRSYVARGTRKIATVCAGYGDGVPRLLSGRGYVLIGGQRAPIAGKVCMDHFCVDVTGLDVQMGDKVTIFGPGLPVEDVAAWAETVHYEILCGITKRVPRVYK